jgi:PhzF family phenazine biosynthesis protein
MKGFAFKKIDAFSDGTSPGNPAGCIYLQEPGDITAQEMQKIAMENNLAETAFYVRKEATDFPELNLTGKFIYEIRWFTPTIEVELCGHATLATAFVLFTHENHPDQDIYFASQSGLLKVSRENDFLILDFPSDQIIEIEI